MLCVKMKISGKVHEVSTKGSDYMFPKFHSTKDTSVAFAINRMVKDCSGKVDGFKSSDALVASISCGSKYDMVLNPDLDFCQLSFMVVGVS